MSFICFQTIAIIVISWMTNLHSTSGEIQTIHLIASILTLISKQGIMDTCFVEKHLSSTVIQIIIPKQLIKFMKISELLLLTCISLFLTNWND